MTMAQIKTAWKQGYGYKETGNGVHQKFADQMAMKTVKTRLLKAINNTHSGLVKKMITRKSATMKCLNRMLLMILSRTQTQ